MVLYKNDEKEKAKVKIFFESNLYIKLQFRKIYNVLSSLLKSYMGILP